MKRLENKVAVIYGNGAVGTTVAKSFAREGAQVYLAGRTLSKLEAVSQQILSLGGTIEIDQVDAMNEDSVERTWKILSGNLERLIFRSTQSVCLKPVIRALPYLNSH
jgi:NADP-dependent 3-hydroxy acid dehydrogenase YdfG